MSVNLLTRIIAICMFFLLLVISTFIIWAWQEMDKPYQINSSYHEIKTELESDIALSLEQYLGSGDASKLQQAENQLNLLKQKQIKWLTEDQKQTIDEAITALQNAIQKARSAGKLAATPDILLINNEQQRHAIISDLIGLLSLSTLDTESKHNYQTELLSTSQKLQQVSRLRQRYLQSNIADYNNTLKQQLLDENKGLAISLQKLNDYPTLGIYRQEEVDEFSFDDPEPTDISKDNIANISSLTSRYPKELSNTVDLLEAVNQSRLLISRELHVLINNVALFARVVETQKQKITTKVKIIGSISLLFFILMISALVILEFKTLSFIQHLLPFFDALTRGDFSQSLDINSKFKEFIVVKSRSIHLQQYLQQLTSALQLQSEQALCATDTLQKRTQQAIQSSQSQRQQTALVSTAINQLSSSFSEVAKNAADSCAQTDLAVKLVTKADQTLAIEAGKTKQLSENILSLSKLVQQLSDDTYSINNVLDVINNVSKQTNLLALNAAIEAARAGEQGRGFAVVADEVRALALRTSQSTHEIQMIIDQLVATAQQANNYVSQQSDVAIDCASHSLAVQTELKSVATIIEDINNYSTNIAAATEQQAMTITDVAENTATIENHAQEVNNNMFEIKQSSAMIADISTVLDQLIKQLKR